MIKAKLTNKIIISTIIIVLIGLAIIFNKFGSPAPRRPIPANLTATTTASATDRIPKKATTTKMATASEPTAIAGLTAPISGALSRITKKPFGIWVSPNHSPVSPERFMGYHTGTDFETTLAETDSAVPIYAVCNGPLVYKNYVSGYGGVAIERCTINNQTVTVLYGHLKLSSITGQLGDRLRAGQKIAILGKGYSQETDGERKHLHLSIHKGPTIVLLGYVQNLQDLNNWLDPAKYLPL